MLRPTLALLVLTLAACTGGSADARLSAVHVDTLPDGVLAIRSDGPAWTDSAAAWSLVEEVRYGGDEGSPGELVDPQSFVADDAGRLYVVDSKPALIKVFSPDGTFLRTMGREGSGPGELRVGFIATRGDRVAIHDPQLGRTSVFDTSGAFIKSAVTFCCWWGEISIDSAQRIVIPAFITGQIGEQSSGSPYARYRLDLTPIDTFWVSNTITQRMWTFTARGPDGKERAQMSMLVPFAPRVQHALHPWGGVVRGISDAYRIVRAPGGTDSTWVASRPWSGDPIPEERRVARLEEAVKSVATSVGEDRARQTARLADIPSTAPAFTRLAVDEEGNIWARQLLNSDSTQTTFEVWDPRGVWLGTLRLPYGFAEYGGAYFGRGAVYLKTEDDEGRPVIVRVRVKPRP